MVHCRLSFGLNVFIFSLYLSSLSCKLSRVIAQASWLVFILFLAFSRSTSSSRTFCSRVSFCRVKSPIICCCFSPSFFSSPISATRRIIVSLKKDSVVRICRLRFVNPRLILVIIPSGQRYMESDPHSTCIQSYLLALDSKPFSCKLFDKLFALSFSACLSRARSFT